MNRFLPKVMLVSVLLFIAGSALAGGKDVRGPMFKPGSPGVRELGSLEAADGFIVKGFEFNDQLGARVTSIGDMNGDGIDDFAVLANNAGNDKIASVYVIFGSTTGFPLQLNASDLDGSNGFAINGAAAVSPGLRQEFTSIAGPGDINGDGFADLVMGLGNALAAVSSQAGKVYVVYGSSTTFPAVLETVDINGANGFSIDGVIRFGLLGDAAGGGGDFNNDGKPDLLIGAGFHAGTYVLYGRADNFPHPFDLATLDGSNGFLINSKTSDGQGISVDNIGDINGDGIADIGMGASGADPTGTSRSGTTYIIYGSASFGASFDLAGLNGSNGFEVRGVNSNGSTGQISAAGDFNGDGVADLAIGTANGNPDGLGGGRSDVLFGSTTPFPALMDLNDIKASNGFTFFGEFRSIFDADHAGLIKGVGDINGDGIGDIAIGASGAAHNPGGFDGEVYVIYGARSGLPSSMSKSEINGNNGMRFLGSVVGDTVGGDIAGRVDVNKDGFDDLIVGARGVDPSEFGATYVIFGKPASDIPTPMFASLLPSARSGFVGGADISVFATVVNGSSNPASKCAITTPDLSPATIRYFETNPATNAITGTQNTVFNLAANESKSFVLFFTPTKTSTFGQEVFPVIACDNAFVEKIPGVNGEFLTIGSVAGPDILSISVTGSGNGIIELANPDGAGFMAISALNNGVGDGSTADPTEVTLTASIRPTFPILPLIVQVCETDNAGTCLAPPGETVDLAIGDNPSFIGVFAFGQGTAIPLDAAKTRITVDFKGADGSRLSSTSVAVMTQ